MESSRREDGVEEDVALPVALSLARGAPAVELADEEVVLLAVGDAE